MAHVTAQQALTDAALYRVFLRDGSTILSYGEYARVGDRVVVSLPLGGTDAGTTAPALHLLSIPADTVDWERTDSYADSVRATRYAATRGPDEFALLSEAVSRALNDIGLTADPNRKIAMALEARQSVTRWAAEHYGYRADRIAQMASLFDDVIAETRARAGVRNFDLSLIANMAAPPAVPLLPVPTPEEGVEQALAAVSLSPEATERASLLRAIERVLDGAGAGGAAWTAPLRARAAAALAIEERADRGYDVLTRTTLRSADRYVQLADVTGVERVIRRALTEDDRLGQRRPQEMASLLAMLDARLDAARRLRLARDSWAARLDSLRRYRASLAVPLSYLQASRDSLDQIRRLAGPSRAEIRSLAGRMTAATTLMAVLQAPAEAEAAHGLLTSAIRFASRAAENRERAIVSGDMQPAWEASSAAAGALMLLDRVSQELQTLMKIPAPQAPR